MKIYVTGFMGSGKTTYGKELAEELGYDFFDLDKAVEKKAGKSIADIFEKEGEGAFRTLESETLHETAKLDDNTVIATGGGTPCFHDNMDWMNAHGRTVYLKLFEPELQRRLADQLHERPLLKELTEDTLLDFIYKTLRERASFYHQANMVIDQLNMPAAELAKLVR
jgi:shikimate kinase